jgi:alkylation response protein AidB-like acyl-CoA dehydrogenase
MLREDIQPLVKQFRANARQTELSASVPHEHVEKLQAAGFFKALQPQAYGGAELAISEYAESVVVLAQGCASTAWACSLLANHSHGLGLFSEQAQDDVWAQDQSTLVSSSVAPLGKYEDTEGGIILSGEFGWSSGCDHAQWAIVGYMGVNELGQAGPCYALIPRSDYQIIEDWDSAALSGTGSKTLKVENAFVPEHRCESLLGLNVQMSKGTVYTLATYSRCRIRLFFRSVSQPWLLV